MTVTISEVSAFEVLDSRGNPTVSVKVGLSDGSSGKAIVPSGASTGKREALEVRDGDKHRFLGKGVLGACATVDRLSAELVGICAYDQAAVDGLLKNLCAIYSIGCYHMNLNSLKKFLEGKKIIMAEFLSSTSNR